MIQFNLLPDVKLEFVKAQRTKRMVMGSALIATAATFALFLLLFVIVHGVQKKNLNDLNEDIKEYSTELKQTPNLNKILTIQNQLKTMGGLHDAKPSAARALIFLQQLTPSDVTVSEFATDYVEGTVTITGQAPGLSRVNTFTDTLKFATYSANGLEGEKAFSNVVLEQFSRNEEDTTYTIKATYDPALFSNANTISLTVPRSQTSRSIVEQPQDLFKREPATNTNQQAN